MRVSSIVGACAAAFIMLGCVSDENPTKESQSVPSIVAGPSVPPEWRQQEAQMRRASLEIPGYGGHFLDENGNLVVYLRDVRHEMLANRVLQPALAWRQKSEHYRGLTAPKVLIWEASYTFEQLNEWRDELADPLASLPGIISLDLDEARNRVTVGVDFRTAGSARLRAEELAANLDIPLTALAFVDEDTAYVDTAYADVETAGTLTDTRRPVVAGLQVTYKDGDVKGCTIALVMQNYGAPAVVTNTHCSTAWGELDNGIYYQSYAYSYNRIGRETEDKQHGDCGFTKCRRSDAMVVGLDSVRLIRYAAGDSLSYFKIARPDVYGSPSIDPYQPEYKIIGKMDALVGDQVCIVGRKSGRRCGPVDATCKDIYQWFQKRLLCNIDLRVI